MKLEILNFRFEKEYLFISLPKISKSKKENNKMVCKCYEQQKNETVKTACYINKKVTFYNQGPCVSRWRHLAIYIKSMHECNFLQEELCVQNQCNIRNIGQTLSDWHIFFFQK